MINPLPCVQISEGRMSSYEWASLWPERFLPCCQQSSLFASRLRVLILAYIMHSHWPGDWRCCVGVCVLNRSDSVWRYWRAFDHNLFQCSLDVLANTFLSEHDWKSWSKPQPLTQIWSDFVLLSARFSLKGERVTLPLFCPSVAHTEMDRKAPTSAQALM